MPIVPARVWAEREEDDDSVFGVANALTAHARREPGLDRRLQLERGAARILATLGQHGDGGSEPSAKRYTVLA